MLARMDLNGYERDERWQRYARLARALTGMPFGAVSVLCADAQWFRGCDGLPVEGTARAVSFCGHAIHADDVFEVPDASLDPRFADNPLVADAPGVRFYAGFPIRVPGELAVGALCVIDFVPRRLDDAQRRALRDLADCLQSEMSTLLSVADMHSVAKDLFAMLPSA